MAPDPAPDQPSKLGKFIQTYHSFLSSFVIGAAGLIATSIWQYRQSEIAARQADSQQHIAASQAENSWRIERAEILAKNLQTLSTSGENGVEQRYGVLLSLTRGNILDPELAVSYALELGKDNPDYMKSVLESTADKSYSRLANAFELTCEQRFGVNRDVPLCKNDNHADRSEALAELIGDETEAARRAKKPGPMILLDDEREVQGQIAHLAWLFTPYLSSLYERRQWSEILWFEGHSVSARLISAMVLGPNRSGEFVTSTEAPEVSKFHEDRIKFLVAYLFGASCNGECKGRMVDFALTSLDEAQGRLDSAFRELIRRPRGEVATAFARLNARLLLCQVQDDDEVALRDRVLVPVLDEEQSGQKPDGARIGDVLALLSLVADPAKDSTDPSQIAAHRAWQQALDKSRTQTPDRFRDAFVAHRATAQATRSHPPPNVRGAMFCSAAEVPPVELNLDNE